MARPRKNKIQGAGDIVHAAAEASGLKKLVEWIAGEDCGCDDRRQRLNHLLPFRKHLINCPTEAQMNYLQELFQAPIHQLNIIQQRELGTIYKRIYGITINSQCDSCWRDYLKDLRKVYDEYKDSND